VLAVQNAVDYADLGVATSGATLFRSLGVATLGAIFSNRLHDELKRLLPRAVSALVRHGLLRACGVDRAGDGGGPRYAGSEGSGYELTDDGRAALALLVQAGEQRLADLLQGWRPEEHEELARMIAAVARQFFVDPAALCAPLGAGAG